jgi:phosphate transport system substrate-binding protein
VRNDTYPIIRYLYLYTVDTPQGEAKSFIDWILKEGQKTVRDVGYVPLWEIP